MKRMHRTAAVIHGFVGAGAIAGGLAGMLNPLQPMGIDADALRLGPFSTFLIPGIILFTFIGLGNICGLLMTLLRPRLSGYAGCLAGGALVIWIIVQCVMLQDVVLLHVIYLVIGMVQGVLGCILLVHYRQFPAVLVMRILGITLCIKHD